MALSIACMTAMKAISGTCMPISEFFFFFFWMTFPGCSQCTGRCVRSNFSTMLGRMMGLTGGMCYLVRSISVTTVLYNTVLLPVLQHWCLDDVMINNCSDVVGRAWMDS